ncbi:hypothetical protein GOODEAATRI_001877 [Goodea atripinnis]|uniref:Teneurin-1-4-like galactose-binding domain-containing protein n=1 Tax=Goodea atripinnis TaxID=208336 RepID=A0ABV0PK26_9TELE
MLLVVSQSFLNVAIGKSSILQPENNSIDTGQVDIGKRAAQSVPPGVFWRSQLSMEQPHFLKFNISVQKSALIGVYGRKGLVPSHTQSHISSISTQTPLQTITINSKYLPQENQQLLYLNICYVYTIHFWLFLVLKLCISAIRGKSTSCILNMLHLLYLTNFSVLLDDIKITTASLYFLQYDFVELLDGSRLIAKEQWTLSEPDTRARIDHPVTVHQAGFIQYLDSGVWHFAFYNDGRSVEIVSYNTIIQGMRTHVCWEGQRVWNDVQ